MIKIVAISDPHGMYDMLEIPKADIFICTGDFTNYGSWVENMKFFAWVRQLPCKYKILVPGNHDLDIEANPGIYQKTLLPKDTFLLINAGVNLMGLSFWGTPYTPEFFDWAFMLPRDRMHEVWANVPPGIDFLLTHGPAYGILDKNAAGESCGCQALLKCIEEDKPRHHLFGHIHHSYGRKGNAYNCSILNDNYTLTNKPVVINVTKPVSKRIRKQRGV